MKKALSVILALVMVLGIFSAPLNHSYASTTTLQVTTSNLNVRDSIWGSRIGSVYKDEKHTSLESKKDSSGDTWYAISYQGKKGWVHGDFVKVSSTSSTTSNSLGKLTVTTSVLNVRDKVWGSVVAQVKQSEVFTYSETVKDSKGDNWYKIEKGWVHGDFVKAEPTATEKPPATTPPVLGKLTINADALRVRTSAWGSYLTTVYKGSVYDYYSSQKAGDGTMWFQIEVDGQKGFVHGGYVLFAKAPSNPTPPATPTPPKETVAGRVKVTTSALNIRNNIWGTWIKTAYEGEVYDYLSTAKDSSGKTWYKIKVGSSSGWVHGDFVKVESTSPAPPAGSSDKTVIGSLNVTTSVLNVRDDLWGKWIGQTYNSTQHHYYSTKKDSSGNTWYEIGFAGGSGWIHGDFVSLSGSNPIHSGNVVAKSSGVSDVYALEEFSLEVTLKDSAGKALTGRASRLGATVSGAERPSLITVGAFKEVSAGVYRASARINDSHQRVTFTFTLDGQSLKESATVNSTASEFQERWLDQNVGTYMNLDGIYGYQCKDVLDYYSNDMYGNYRTIVGRGDAKDLFYGPSDQYFIKIRREATGVNSIPKMGDVIIYGGGSRNPAGHLSIVISATATSIRVLEQNANGAGSSPAMYATRPYSGGSSGEVIGWLRPRVHKINNTN